MMAYLIMAWNVHTARDSMRFPYVLKFSDGRLYRVRDNVAGPEETSPWDRRKDWTPLDERWVRREAYIGDLRELGERLGVPAEMLPADGAILSCERCHRVLGTVQTYGPYEGEALRLRCPECGGSSTPLGLAALYVTIGQQRAALAAAIEAAKRQRNEPGDVQAAPV
jgi:hypothetical protein